MARRKRMPYDPPHARTGRSGRRSGPPARPEHLFMTRRMFLAKGAIVGVFGALAAKLGHMQLVRGAEFTAKAEQNTKVDEVLKPTRGVIYDRKGRELASNERTWEVRVLPAALPKLAEEPEARARVLDQLINALNLPDALVLQPNGVPKGQEATVYARTAQLLGKALTVEPTDQPTQLPVTGTIGTLLRANGHDLHLFVYADEAARKRESALITRDGTKIQGRLTPWQGGAKVVSKGNVLTILDAPDRRTAGRVQRAIENLGQSSTADDVVAMLRQNGFDEWASYIRAEAPKNYLVNLEDDLTPDLAALCRAHQSELPGVKVVNRLEYLIENGIGAERVTIKRGVPREVALKLEANKLALPGVELDGGDLTRRYRGGEAMSHILGYVGTISREQYGDHNEAQLLKAVDDPTLAPLYEQDDVIGQDGLERVMEPLLRGVPGSRVVQRNAAGGVDQVEANTEVLPTPGKNLNLSIDLELQRAAGELLREGVRFANEDRRALGRVFAREAGAGSVVAIDPRNGEVLAMVSYPHYDNQLFVDGISERKYAEYVSEEANKPLFDRALRGAYPPGSTAKLFHAAAGLNERKIDTKSSFRCTGGIKIPLGPTQQNNGNPYPCWNKEGHQTLDVFGAIEQSCDVFFFNNGTPGQPDESGDKLHYFDLFDFGTDRERVGDRHDFLGLGIELIKKNLKDQFWFGQPTGIDLPTEEAADNLWVRHADKSQGWSAGDTINVSIGQGEFESTPLQLAINTAALGNGGRIPKPRLVRETFRETDAVPEATEPEELRKLSIAAEHLATVKEGMRRVVHGDKGSARANFDGSSKWALTNPWGEPEILIAGKTGTAELGEADEDGTYSRQHAWFTLFAPLDDPEIAITVIIEDGGEGSASAVPLADRMLRAYFETKGRRRRGLVLKPEEGPLARDASVLAPTAEFPKPGTTSIPGDLRQD